MLLKLLKNLIKSPSLELPVNIPTLEDATLDSIVSDTDPLVVTTSGKIRASEVIKIFLVRISKKPLDQNALTILGRMYKKTNQQDEALYYYKLLEYHFPNELEAYLGQNSILRNQGQYAQACEACDRAIAKGLDCGTLRSALAMTLYFKGEIVAAEANFLSAIETSANDCSVLSDYGMFLRETGQYHEGYNVLSRSVQLNPKHTAGWINLGTLLADIAEKDKALSCYDKAIALNPDSFFAPFNRCLMFLQEGNFKDGWDPYELRFSHPHAKVRFFPFKTWSGENIQDKTLFIYGEQGLGDEIMFSSCLEEASARAKKVIVECDNKLKSIFLRSFPNLEIISREELELPRWGALASAIDLQAPVGSLPRFFRRSSSDFPHHQGYLTADPSRISFWRDRLNELGPGLKIGFSWRGGTKFTRRILRSTELVDWLPVFRVRNCTFVNLQYNSSEAELSQLKSDHQVSLYSDPRFINDYDETAAMVCAVDLVISVQTALVHLAGALGKEAWVLLPSSPEWRYGSTGDRMIWYPSVRLIRNVHSTEWTAAIKEIESMLRTRVANKSRHESYNDTFEI